MSEYQFVHFLAVDRPLDEKQLAYMQRQSTRAEITPWEFTNEYHWGDFRGNVLEMLRRGYDLHLHYANFGVRRLMIRLPAGLPCDNRTFEAFRAEYGMKWHADKTGKGGILEIYPESDADTYDEIFDDLGRLLPEIAPVRESLIGGDLRALYLGWLACGGDGETMEPPVPAGLGELTRALNTMAEFYDLSEDLIAAAAERSPPLPKAADAGETLNAWIARQSNDELKELVVRLLTSDAAAVRAETLSRIRDEMDVAVWPMAEPTRTLGQLRELADAQGEERLGREEKARQAKRRKHLAAIAADPQKVIKNVQSLVAERSTHSYEEAARELEDLREALGPDRGPAQAREVAEKLRRENPRRNQFIATLRRHGLLD